MAFSSGAITFMLCFLLAVMIGICVLEWFLSKREPWWLGLLLPLLFFLLGTIPMLNLLEETSAGEVLLTFILGNIPTWILLLIYILNRQNLKKNRELEQMKIKDL
ncbi:hypothetical protein [Anaerotignum sp.]